MNIYKYELKANARSTILFMIGMLVFLIFYMTFYPSFASDTGNFMDMLKNYPEALQKALGVAFENITTLLGYYSFILVYVVLVGAVQSANLGLNSVSKEERDKTAEFLLVKPVSRMKILTAKRASILILVLFTIVVYNIGSYLILKLMVDKPFDLKTFFLLNSTLLIIQLVFIALGFFIGIFIKRMRTIMPVSLALVFGLFAIGAFAVNADDDKLRYLSPFKYYDYNYILANQSFEAGYLIFALILILVLLITSFIIYQKRDIESV